MEVIIESPAYMKSKAQEQPHENIQSKISQSGELFYVFSIGAQTNNFKLLSYLNITLTAA